MDIIEESGEVKIVSCLKSLIHLLRVCVCIEETMSLIFFQNRVKDVTKLYEVQNVSVVLDVIAWICDGQNEKMQKVLREQDIHLDVGMNTKHPHITYVYVVNCILNFIIFTSFLAEFQYCGSGSHFVVGPLQQTQPSYHETSQGSTASSH